jgi:hypothetical protein
MPIYEFSQTDIDITRRLLEHATAIPNGLLAKNVDLPVGNHWITLSIADTTGKRAPRTLRFPVVHWSSRIEYLSEQIERIETVLKGHSEMRLST